MKRRGFLGLGASVLNLVGHSTGNPEEIADHFSPLSTSRPSYQTDLTITPPNLPADHFIGLTDGITPLESNYYETLLRLHADAVFLPGGRWEFPLWDDLTDDFAVSLRHQTIDRLQTALQTGLPAAQSASIKIDTSNAPELSFVNALVSEGGWTRPDGTSVDEPRDVFAETIDGDPWTVTETRVPSLFSPAAFAIATTRAGATFADGSSAVGFDNVRTLRKRGLDFSNWARASFRDHLASLSTDRLTELGIETPESFDIRAYLERQDFRHPTDDHPATDPVFREYLLHHHRRVKEYHDDLRAWLRETYPDRSPPLSINQPFGDPDLSETAVAETYASDHVDLISVEDWRTMPAEEFGRRDDNREDVPSKDIRDYVYKLAWASGRYETPVRHGDGLGGRYYEDIEPGQQFPNLLRLQAGEAYAMGCRQVFNIRQGPMAWRDQDWTVPGPLQEFIDFLWAHQRFLTGVEPDNTVGVVWSLPTLLWNTLPQWFTAATAHTHSFAGTATLLREAQIPYDVLVFGHPDLWPDGDLSARLAHYDAVVLPAAESLTNQQATALEAYRADGGVVLASGSPPDRTGSFDLTSFDIFDRSRAVVLASNPGKQRIDEGTSDPSLVDTLTSHGIDPITARANDTVGVNQLAQPAASRRIIHLLNYDYAPDADEFRRKTDVEIRLSGLEERFNVARYYSPQQITDITVRMQDGRRELTVPELVEWGFIVVAPSEDHLADSETGQTAADNVEAAETELRSAREEDRQWSSEYRQAELKHRAAETALGFGAHSLAIEEAETAVELATAAYGPPVVAVDQAHGQRESQNGGSNGGTLVEQLRHQFPEYEYRTLEEWGDTTLTSMDVLLVPPALSFKGARHGFAADEIEQIESFVTDGGSLAVFARGGVASDINDLLAPFDLRFQGSAMKSSDHSLDAKVRDSTHRLTLAFDRMQANLGTPVAEMPEHARVLASVPEGSEAWLDLSDGGDDGEDDPSVAGAPVYTVQQHGEGLVVAIGTTRQLYDPTESYSRNREVIQQLLTVLGGHARRRRSDRSSRSTATGTPSERSPVPSATPTGGRPTTSDGAPGFGVLAAIAGIGGLLVHLLRIDDEDE